MRWYYETTSKFYIDIKSIIMIILVQGHLELEHPRGNLLQIHPLPRNTSGLDVFPPPSFVGWDFFFLGRNTTRAMELFAIHGKRISCTLGLLKLRFDGPKIWFKRQFCEHDPKKIVKWPPNMGYKGHGLNHLVVECCRYVYCIPW